MTPRAFYSFHYVPDNWRAAQVRNMGVVEGNEPASDNDWEAVKRGGDAAIERWIGNQLRGRSCCVVLVGAQTAKRKWIDYEIHNSWNWKKGVLGVHVHNLKNSSGAQALKGVNPFAHIRMQPDDTPLSSIVRTDDPPHSDSKEAYDYIKRNLANWIDEAVSIRNSY